MSTSMDELIAAAKLGGRIDILVELKRRLEQKLKDADRQNEQMRGKETYEHDTRSTSNAATH